MNVTVPVVEPAAIVISDSAPKSVPSVAPDVSRGTVIAAVVATDNVAVRVKELPSATLEADEVKVTVGALSPSVIVIDAVFAEPKVTPPPLTLPIVIVASSFAPSYKLSAVGLNAAVAVVVPAGIVIFARE